MEALASLRVFVGYHVTTRGLVFDHTIKIEFVNILYFVLEEIKIFQHNLILRMLLNLWNKSVQKIDCDNCKYLLLNDVFIEIIYR